MNYANQQTSSKIETYAENSTELSILEAIKLAFSSALEWNDKAQLLSAVNIDLDEKDDKGIGINGKRKYWNIAFAVPDTNKYFLVTIHKGKIDDASDFTVESSSPYPKNELMQIKDIKHDSPELLKKALELGGIHPGEDWAKGYNFMIKKDPESGIPLMLVIGWNKELKNTVAVYFNVTTGEHLVSSN
ncbi:hypothetical protein [Lysinibacillus mangiferihumi]|uniref:hypothetical protein n=1 Tax=Lysinibacillus mangiferihumi TaxID=1130819 RepID=UPI001F22A2B4|nr:hypothetical protein [Lysinibacillus mangiferihumi]